jgi:hypothetical protein
MMKKVLAYALGFVIAPKRAIDRLADDPLAMWVGFWWTLLFLFAYSVTVLVFWLLGHQPVSRGWLTIPPDRWYLVQTFTTIPVGLASFFSYAGLLHLLCRSFGGKGSFEATFAAEMYCAIVPCVVFMLILEMLVAPVAIALGMRSIPWPNWVEILRTFVFPFIWIFALSVLSLQKVHGTHPLAGFAFTLLALIPTGMIMAVFIR